MAFCQIRAYRFGYSGGLQDMVGHRVRSIVADVIQQAPFHIFGSCLNRYRNGYSKIVFGDSPHIQNRT